jgi:hypothetical protein
VNTRLEFDFNRRNTTVFLGAAYAQDEVDPVGGALIGFADAGGGEDDGTRTRTARAAAARTRTSSMP